MKSVNFTKLNEISHKMKNLLVSIITPTYNSAFFIENTLVSILNQTHQNWELLITDDCSTDETWQLLQEYTKKDNRIKAFQIAKNSGAGIARNNSIKNASGRFIAFCDSDDQWKPDKLEKQIDFMFSKNCALTYTSYDTIDEEGNPIGIIHAQPFLTYKLMLRNNYIGCLTAIYDTEKVGKLYMPEIRKRQDWALWLSILKKSDKAYGLNKSLAIYRNHNNSISTNKFKLIKYNYAIYKEVEKFSTIKSIIRLIIFLFFYFQTKYWVK
jgi:teichuronic acid biosynthesis glycosyltransferase TuaG